MTSLFQSRRDAEEFAAAVDDGEHRPARSDEVSNLARIVDALRHHQPVTPREQFARDLRSRLLAEAETALGPETSTLLLPQPRPGRRERRLAAAASALVLVGGTTSMAAASQSSLPGDALYPIKRGIERAEAGLSLSTAGKGRDILGHAHDRLSEVQAMVDSGSTLTEPRVPATLADFQSSAAEGSYLLFEAFRNGGDPGEIVTVRTFTTQTMATIESLASQVAPSAQQELSAAAVLLRELDREASSLCGSCAGDLPAVEVPEVFLAGAEVDRALDRAAATELTNSHPVVVPKGAVEAVQQATQPQPAPTPTTAAGQVEGPVSSATPTAYPTATPADAGSWPSLLPVLGDGTGATPEATPTPGELAESLTDLVETIMPDTGDGDLGLLGQ